MDLGTILMGGASVLALGGTAGVGAWILSLRRVVPTNMVHIVQRQKASTSYGRGKSDGNVYYEWPSWLPVMGVKVTEFPESVFDIGLDEYEAYDVGRLPFVVDVRAFFRVDDSGTVAQRVASFPELREQLKSVLQGAVRRVLGTEKLEEIMQDRSKLGDSFTQEVNTQLKEWGVTTVKSIEFMDIRDSRGSTVIADIMAKEKSRIEMESRVTVADNRREAELREIEAKRTVDIGRQEAEQQVGIRTAEKEREVGIAEERSHQEVQAQAKITAQREADVKQVQDVRAAEITRDVTLVKAEQDKQQTIIHADAVKERTIREADAKRQQTEIVAQGDLQAAKLAAEGTLATGEAKAKAEELILMAPVTAQITLAREIGENEGYQHYLVTIEQVNASKAVGIEMAGALKSADLKVIANSGDVQGGVANLTDLFSSKGGTSVGALLEGLSQTDQGRALVGRLTGTGTGVESSSKPSTATSGGAAATSSPANGSAGDGRTSRRNGGGTPMA